MGHCNATDVKLQTFHVSFSFLLSWPADMISLKPGKGTIKSRYEILFFFFLPEVFIFRLVSLAYLSRRNKVKCSFAFLEPKSSEDLVVSIPIICYTNSEISLLKLKYSFNTVPNILSNFCIVSYFCCTVSIQS